MTTITATSGPDVTIDAGPTTVMEATSIKGGPIRPLSSKKSVPSHTFTVVDAGAEDSEPVRQPGSQSLWATTLLITTLCGVTFASSMTTGLLAVAIPTMAKELNISDGLLLW